MSKWIAGWNLPGCIPEMEPCLFETEEEGWAFIEESRSSYLDDMGSYFEDPYTYWVEPYSEDEND